MKLHYLIFLLLTSWNLNAQLAITMPGDFEKHNGLMLSWSSDENINLLTTTLLTEVQQSVDSVWILYHSDSTTMDTLTIRQYIIENGGSLDHVFFLPADYQSNWIRSALPGIGFAAFDAVLERFVYSSNQNTGTDSLAFQLGQYFNFPISEIPLVIDGNNLLHDGLRNGFSTRQMLADNPGHTESEMANILRESFNLNNWVFLEPMQNSGGGLRTSIDDFMQIVDFETVMVTSYPDTLPDYPISEQNVDLLEGLLNAFGQSYTIYRIPAAPLDNGRYPTQPEDELRTYTNSLIVNNMVIIPEYDMPFYDSVALHRYQMAMPGYHIVPVGARTLSQQHSSLKSLGVPMPQDHYLRIEHKKLTGLQPYQSEIQVTCISKAGEMVQDMWLYYKKNSDTNYTQTPVYLVCPEHFGKIEDLLITDTVSYYLEAISTTETTMYPLSAPEGNFTFWFDPLLNLKEIDSEPITLYPNPGNGILNFNLNKTHSMAEVQLFDLKGNKLQQTKVTSGQSIDWSEMLKPGIYLVRVIIGNETETIRYHVR